MRAYIRSNSAQKVDMHPLTPLCAKLRTTRCEAFYTIWMRAIVIFIWFFLLDKTMTTVDSSSMNPSINQDESGIQQRLSSLETRVGLIEAVLAGKNAIESATSEEDIASLLDKIQTKDAIIICYRKYGPQTKEQAKAKLKTWGTPFGSWFEGGNFAAHLVRKGILTTDGKDPEGRDIFTLTIKGRKIADEIIEKKDATN
jgi:hypothetical protein